LPPDLSGYDLVHVTPAAGPRWQVDMVHACRQRGARMQSAATFPCSSREAAEAVRDVIAGVDIFFMNADEATAVFGSLEDAATSPGRLLYVTQGADGVLVFEGRQRTHLPAAPAEELDPTGAGDSFAGAVLAYLMQGYSPAAAAQRAVLLAADVVSQPGPSALFAG
jgi:sugar/nucleoside kinase (ribokinase family)